MAKKKAAKPSKAVKAKAAPAKPPKQPRPKQQRLPGTEDARIAKLENLADEYVEARDERLAAGVIEQEKKGELLGEMKRLKRAKYKHDGYTIERTVEKEGIKVRVHKEGEVEEDEGDAGEVEQPDNEHVEGDSYEMEPDPEAA